MNSFQNQAPNLEENPFAEFVTPAASADENPFAEFVQQAPQAQGLSMPAPEPFAKEEKALDDATRNQPGLASDMWGSFGMGSGQLLSGAGWLFGSETLGDIGDSTTEYWEKTLSDAQRESMGKRFVNEDFSAGDALTDPRSWAGVIVQSLPAMATGMSGAALGTRGALALGAGKGAAIATGAAAGSAMEGATIAGMVGDETYKTVMAAPPEQISQSPYFQDLIKLGADEQQAREQTAQKAAEAAALPAGVGGAILGMAFNKFVGDAVTGSLSSRFTKESLKGGAIEGSTEVAQGLGESGSKQASLNEYANQDYNLSEIANEMVAGGGAGVAMGSAVGGLGALTTRQNEQDARQSRIDQLVDENGNLRDTATNPSYENINLDINPFASDAPETLALPGSDVIYAGAPPAETAGNANTGLDGQPTINGYDIPTLTEQVPAEAESVNIQSQALQLPKPDSIKLPGPVYGNANTGLDGMPSKAGRMDSDPAQREPDTRKAVDRVIGGERYLANKISDYQKEKVSQERAASLPENLNDTRWLREETASRPSYKQAVKSLSDELIKGGGVGLIRNENDVVTGRAPSLNPKWAQEIMASENATVGEIKMAVNKAMKPGAKLGNKQARVISRLLDVVEGEYTSADNIEHAKKTRAEKNLIRKAIRENNAIKNEFDTVQAQIPDDDYSDFHDSEFDAEQAFSQDEQIEAEALIDAMRAGVPEAITDELSLRIDDSKELATAIYKAIREHKTNGQRQGDIDGQGAQTATQESNQGRSETAVPENAGRNSEVRNQEVGRSGQGNREGQSTGQVEDKDELLTTYTEDDIRQREAEKKAAQEKEQTEKAEAEAKEKADKSVDDFQLAGSDRKADANPDQTDIFDTDQAAPKSDQAKAESDQAPEAQPSSQEEINKAANEAATSEQNDLPEPTKAQKEAGNYKLGKVKVQGLDISIENPKASKRSGTSPDGKEWSNTMGAHYGYLRKTEGADGDHVDVFLGDFPDSDKVWIVDQVNQDGSFDEHKVLMGFKNKITARKAYASSYDKGWKVGPITQMLMDDFKQWVKGDTKKPLKPSEIQPAKVAKQEAKTENKAESPLTTKGAKLADKAAEKFEDFGETLSGARKHTFTFKEAMDEDIDVKAVPLSKSFPKPDYEKLAAEGVPVEALAFVAQLRANIPTKPKVKYKLSSWASKVEEGRKAATEALSMNMPGEAWVESMKKGSPSVRYTATVLRLAKEILPSQIEALGRFKLSQAHYQLYRGETNVNKWVVTDVSKKQGFGGMGNTAAFNSEKEALAYIKGQVTTVDTNNKPLVKFDMWSQRGVPGYFVGKKIAAGKYIELAKFDNRSDAANYITTHNDELVDLLAKKKKIGSHRRAEQNDRIGKDYRRGSNVTSDLFSETFGFRGVQFGNYVENDKRQQDVNNAYDGLLDLAEVLNIPPKALSLNGELGLAFGARGSGGKDAAKAHFEPDTIVINLTKRDGAGSLAHEWWHALDNYFGRMDGEHVRKGKGAPFVTSSARNGYKRVVVDGLQKMTETNSDDFGVRQEAYEAFKGIQSTIAKETEILSRSGRLDDRKTKDYWSTTEEVTARSFERFVIEKLAEEGYESDYLATILPKDAWDAAEQAAGNVLESYPYPTDSEMPVIKKAYQKLFDTLKTKETDYGTALYSRSRKFDPADAIPKAELKKVVDSFMSDYNGNIPLDVIIVEKQEEIYGSERTAEKFGRIEGAYHAAFGKVVLVRTSLRDVRTTQRVLRHEVLGHYGLDTFKPEDKKALLERIIQSRKVPGLRSIWKQIDKLYENDTEMHKAEEVFAFVTEQEDTIFNRFLDYISEAFRKLLRKAGFFKGIISKKDLQETAKIIAEGIRDGSRQQQNFPKNDAAQFSQSEQSKGEQAGQNKRLKKFFDGFSKQPLDRAFRLLFDVTGALDSHGRFKAGTEINEATIKAVKEWRPHPDGHFAFMDTYIETARHGLIDRYKLSDEYKDTFREAEALGRNIDMQALDILKVLESRGLDAAEVAVLQQMLTGEQVKDHHLRSVAEPVLRAIDDLGLMAVEYGVITQEQFDRNRGAYLHRSYTKHEAEFTGLGKWLLNRQTSRQKRKIEGKSSKGRGIEIKLTKERLLKHVPDSLFDHGTASGKPDINKLQGEKFIVLENPGVNPSHSNDIDGLEDQAKASMVEVVYWPTSKPRPKKYESYREKGAYEVRGKRKGKLILWRDYTKAERQNMGEILDARYNIAKTFQVISSDIAMGKFFQDVSKNDLWFQKELPTNGSVLSAGEARSLKNLSVTDWVEVPDTTVAKSAGTKQWGALAGGYVRAEIWRDLTELDKMHNPGAWRKVLTQWKLNKTARSPVVHMNNIMSNMMFMDLADVRLTDLIAGVKSYKAKDEHWRAAQEHAAFEGTFANEELRKKVMEPILNEILKQSIDTSADFENKAVSIGKITSAIFNVWKTFDGGMVGMYQIEDEVFRMATYMRRLSLGDTPKEAARIARETFLDYDIRAPWVNAARRTVLPFISYTYRAVPVLYQAILERPWKLAKYTTVAHVAIALSYMLEPGDEDEERRSMRDDQQGYTWLGAPRMARLPTRDDHGNPVFVDVRRWVPAGDIFDVNQGNLALPYFPSWLQLGGPIMLAHEFALNKQAFTGKEITSQTDTAAQKLSKTADWLYKSWMPSAAYIPGSYYFDKIVTAWDGGRDILGRPYSVPQALLSSFGVKVQPHDVQLGLTFKSRDLAAEARLIRAEARRSEMDYERSIITFEEKTKTLKRAEQKMKVLAEKERELRGN